MKNSNEWKDFTNSTEIELLTAPSHDIIKNKLDNDDIITKDLNDIIIVRFLRPDRFLNAIENYLRKRNRTDFVEPIEKSLKNL